MTRRSTFMLFEFHYKYKLPINADHSDMNEWVARINLIREEVRSLFDEWADIEKVLSSGETPSDEQMSKFLKEMCDIEYVLRGTGVAFGLPYSAGFDAVHASNMTKDGNKKDGKLMKGKAYKAPDILSLFK